MVEKKKTTAKEKVFLICCVVLGLAIGLWLANGLNKPQWQNEQDEEIAFEKSEGTLDHYILTRFVMSLRPDGQVKYPDYRGEAYSYQDMYEYVSQKISYECEQLQEYSDHTPYNEIAECHKK